MISIRSAIPADLPFITSIYAHAVKTGTSSYELEPPSLEEMTSRMEALRSKEYPYLVAEEERRVLGYA